MEKWLILFAVWIIFGLVMLFVHWIYSKEEHLVWCNDYDVIESLQGEKRERYIQHSKQATYRLLFLYAGISLLPAIFPYSNTLLVIIFTLVIIVSIYCICKDFKARKQYKKL